MQIKTIFLATTALVIQNMYGQNLLKNFGFEEKWNVSKSYAAVPEAWKTSANGFLGKYQVPAKSHNIPDNKTGKAFARSGKYAWELAHVNQATGYCKAYQGLKLTAGEYSFSGYVRTTTNNAKSRLFVSIDDDIQFLDAISENNKAYTAFKKTFKVENNGIYAVGFGIFREKKGYGPYAHWDDLEFVQTKKYKDSQIGFAKGTCKAKDSDYDGWLDHFELVMKTDPYSPDTDGDGIIDPLDSNPRKSNGKTLINFVKGDKRYSSGKLPRNFVWANLITTKYKDEKKRNEVLKKFEEWNIYPSFSAGSMASKSKAGKVIESICKANIKQGIPVDAWQCVHEYRSFKKELGFLKKDYVYDNPAVSAIFNRQQMRIAGKTCANYLSQVDENIWSPVVYNKNSFISFLISKGYLPTDFGVKSWVKLPMPNITLPQPKAQAAKVLLKELQLYAQDTIHNYYAKMVFGTRQANSDVKINLGIFAPWGLGYGYYSNLPVTSMYRIREASQTEWDFYDWVYSGDYVRYNNFAVIEAGNQFLTDMLRIPTQLTFSLEFDKKGRTENYYKLFIMSNLLLTDNITGLTFFYYGCPSPFGRATIFNCPRWEWCGKAVKKASKVYNNVHSIKEKNRILIVADDPINMGVGSRYDKDGFKRPNKDFFKGIRYGNSWYNRCYQLVADAGYDAAFCIPSMVPGLDLSRYDVIIVSADYINDFPLRHLRKWSKKGMLLYRKNAAKQDELFQVRKGTWYNTNNIRPLPTDWQSCRKLFKRYVRRAVYAPTKLAPPLRINVRGTKNGRKVIVLANYSAKKASFEVELFARHKSVKKLLNTSSVELDPKGANTILSGEIDPFEFEVLELDK